MFKFKFFFGNLIYVISTCENMKMEINFRVNSFYPLLSTVKKKKFVYSPF